jgi:hypothetical protein
VVLDFYVFNPSLPEFTLCNRVGIKSLHMKQKCEAGPTVSSTPAIMSSDPFDTEYDYYVLNFLHSPYYILFNYGYFVFTFTIFNF